MQRLKVAIETYGCTTNQADSDVMRGFLVREFELSSVEDADVVIINSCGVIDYTERKIMRRIRDLKREGKKVVLAGCLTRISGEALNLADSAISPDNLDRVVDAVYSALNGQKLFTERRFIDKAEMHHLKCRLRENAIAIVSISEGCLGSCSFCATRFARGRLRSFPWMQSLRRWRRLLRQDTGRYS